MAKRPLFVFLVAGLLAALAGCEGDLQVRSYTVAAPKHRLWGAIVRHGDDAWFFKVKGPAKDVAAVQDSLRGFLQSIRFPKDRPEWTLPAGWTREPESPPRFATLKIGKTSPPLELSVTRLPVPPEIEWNQFVLMNVNRWRGEVEQGELELEELGAETHTVSAAGTKVTVVDVTGVPSPKLKMVPIPMGGGEQVAADEPPADLPFEVTVPKEWREKSPGPAQLKAYEVREGEARVEITISQAGGALAANLNRWRGQVGLAPVEDEDELMKSTQTLSVAGQSGTYVTFVGATETIVGVILEGDGGSWFFKLRGDSALARREKDRFEAFVKSVK